MRPSRPLFRPSPKNLFRVFVVAIVLLFNPIVASSKSKASSDQAIQVLDEPTATLVPVETPTPLPTPRPKMISRETNSKTLVLHKPATDPAWGRVMEYHKETVQSKADNTTETLYQFLFQDDQGVVRTAVYHESPSGDGYWEVFVWDR